MANMANMALHGFKTPPPFEGNVITIPTNIKQLHKEAKNKNKYKFVSVSKIIPRNPNSKNQRKKKAKQTARKLFKITQKICVL